MRSHIRVTFYCETTHWCNLPGRPLYYKLFILLDVDILPRFHITQYDALLGVSSNTSLVIIWLGGKGGLEVWGNSSLDSVCGDKGVGLLEYPDQGSIHFYARFHRENLKQDSLNSVPSKVSSYFYTMLPSNCRFENTTVPQIVYSITSCI